MLNRYASTLRRGCDTHSHTTGGEHNSKHLFDGGCWRARAAVPGQLYGSIVGERTVSANDGAQLRVAVEGEGRPLVLCHGGPGLWDYFGPVVESVRDLVSVVTWDQRGSGRSTGAGPHTVSRYVEDLDTIRESFGFASWIVGGHSWGASLALMYALSHPSRCEAIIYISGVGLGNGWNAAYHEEADRRRGAAGSRLAELRDRHRSTDEEHEYRVRTWSADFADRDSAVEMAASIDRPFAINYVANEALSAETKSWAESDLQDRCRSLEVPVLILHGERDPRPVRAIESLSNALPMARVALLPDAGHIPWLEVRGLFEAQIRHFLASIE